MFISFLDNHNYLLMGVYTYWYTQTLVTTALTFSSTLIFVLYLLSITATTENSPLLRYDSIEGNCEI